MFLEEGANYRNAVQIIGPWFIINTGNLMNLWEEIKIEGTIKYNNENYIY